MIDLFTFDWYDSTEASSLLREKGRERKWERKSERKREWENAKYGVDEGSHSLYTLHSSQFEKQTKPWMPPKAWNVDVLTIVIIPLHIIHK